MSVKTYRRGVILICAALCGALTASLNIWSIFQKPLMEAYRLSRCRSPTPSLSL